MVPAGTGRRLVDAFEWLSATKEFLHSVMSLEPLIDASHTHTLVSEATFIN